MPKRSPEAGTDRRIAPLSCCIVLWLCLLPRPTYYALSSLEDLCPLPACWPFCEKRPVTHGNPEVMVAIQSFLLAPGLLLTQPFGLQGMVPKGVFS